jgi:hypothetical protein
MIKQSKSLEGKHASIHTTGLCSTNHFMLSTFTPSFLSIWLFFTCSPTISLILASNLPQTHFESTTNGCPSDHDGAVGGGAGPAGGAGVGLPVFRGVLETKIEGIIGLAVSFEDSGGAGDGVEGGAEVEETRALMNVSREDFGVGR